MENKQKRRLIEWGKNALIVLLSLSALYLLGRTQLYAGGAQSGQNLFSSLLSFFPGPEETEPGQPVGQWT